MLQVSVPETMYEYSSPTKMRSNHNHLKGIVSLYSGALLSLVSPSLFLLLSNSPARSLYLSNPQS